MMVDYDGEVDGDYEVNDVDYHGIVENTGSFNKC
jgi:hypothetical protein